MTVSRVVICGLVSMQSDANNTVFVYFYHVINKASLGVTLDWLIMTLYVPLHNNQVTVQAE